MKRYPSLTCRAFLILASLSLGSSCMTVDHLIDSKQTLAMYGGTVSSYRYIQDDYSPFIGTLIRLIDLPATVVMDTVLLPIVAPIVMSRGDDVEE